jgi:hypothetical protein
MLVVCPTGAAQEEGLMNRITETASFTTRIVGVVEADCPEDGGKWALICEHFENGEWLSEGIIQDTNKRRLAEHASEKRGAGYTDWCPSCQDAHAVLEVK